MKNVEQAQVTHIYCENYIEVAILENGEPGPRRCVAEDFENSKRGDLVEVKPAKPWNEPIAKYAYAIPVALFLLGLVIGGRLALPERLLASALLGLLGLIGMNIKNSVVLVDRIGQLRRSGLEPYEALTEATRSRVTPVVMASGTTILGMLPLLFDSMFGAMAATIMGGLFVATLLTVCVLPVVYAVFYNIRQS